MKRILSFILLSFLFLSIQGQISRYPLHTVKTTEEEVEAPSFLTSDGHTKAWYISSDSVVKDGSNLVRRWGDYLNSTNDLLQATGTLQPTWSTDGITFDGVDNYLRSANNTGSWAISQPATVYVVLKESTFTVWELEVLLDGYGGGSMALQDGSNAGYVSINAGTYLSDSDGDLTTNAYHIIILLFNTTSSSIKIDDHALTSGNAGDGTIGGFTLGCSGGTPDLWADIVVKEVIIRENLDDATGRESVYDYLNSKYSLSLPAY